MHILRSTREITQMRKAGLLVWQAHQLAGGMVKPGVTTGEIDAALEKFFLANNAIPLFKGVPGKVPFPAVTCISVNEEVVHGIPGPRVLKEGGCRQHRQPVCKLDGWCGDSAITHPVGKISADAQHLLDITRGVLELAIELMKHKRRWSEVASEMGAFVRDNGLSVVESFVGHGIGREMHEDPQVPNFVSSQLRRNGDFQLEPGLVIAVEPMVNLGGKQVKGMPDHWTQSTQDGKASAHFEHTIAITEEGPWVLTGDPSEQPGKHQPATPLPARK